MEGISTGLVCSKVEIDAGAGAETRPDTYVRSLLGGAGAKTRPDTGVRTLLGGPGAETRAGVVVLVSRILTP